MNKERPMQIREQDEQIRNWIRHYGLDETVPVDLYGHPIAQVVGTMLSYLTAKVEKLREKLILAENILGDNKRLKVEKLRVENARLRDALRFYADKENYDDNQAPGNFVCAGEDYGGRDEWETDEGDIAEKALEAD